MWISGWVWIKTLRSSKPSRRIDPADMGIDIGPDASLHSRPPPPLEGAAVGRPRTGHLPCALGTDQRSPSR